MDATYFSMHELLPLLMSIPVKFLMAISGESVSEAMEAMLETIERDLMRYAKCHDRIGVNTPRCEKPS